MPAVHAAHYGASILYDGCTRCEELSKNIYDLSNSALIELAKLATGPRTRGLSLNEARAISWYTVYKNTLERSEAKTKERAS